MENIKLPQWFYGIVASVLVVVTVSSYFTGRQLSLSPFGFSLPENPDVSELHGEIEKKTRENRILRDELEELSKDNLLLREEIGTLIIKLAGEKGGKVDSLQNSASGYQARQLEIVKLSVKSVDVSSSYSSQYDGSKLIDGNSNTYWSTLGGMGSNVSLEAVLEEESDVVSLKIYSPSHGSSYSQPKKIVLRFFAIGGALVKEERLEMSDASGIWRASEGSPIRRVSAIKLSVEDSFNKGASYLTINEMEIFGLKL